VIDGLTGTVKGGVGLIEAGVAGGVNAMKNGFCQVYSLIGNGCSDAPPPPTVSSNAAGYCLAHGGLQGLKSGSGKVDDFRLTCNDGTICQQQPGSPPKCATGAEIAAKREQNVALAEAEYQQGAAAWKNSFLAQWLGACPDQACKNALAGVVQDTLAVLAAAHAKQPIARFGTIAVIPLAGAQKQAVNIIEEHKYLVLPGKWAELYKKNWQAKCWDKQCRDAIFAIAFATQATANGKAKQEPRPMYSTMTAAYAQSIPKAVQAVDESLARKGGAFAAIMAKEAAARRLSFIETYRPQCLDAACEMEIGRLASKMEALMNQVQADNPQSPSMVLIVQVQNEYIPMFKQAIEASQRRSGPPVRRTQGETGRRVTPAPAPGPVRRIVVPNPPVRTVTPAPTPTPSPAPIRRIIVPRPAPTPSPSPTPTPRGGRPAPIRP
jgi:hypothetical protein